MKTKNVLLIGVGLLAVAGIAFACTRKKDEKSNATGKTPKKCGCQTNPNTGGSTNKWVSSQEGGNSFCRWYDGNGNNTVTYNKPCTKAQANM